MSTYATRLGTHATQIRSKSGTFRRLLTFLLILLWKNSPRLLLLNVSSALASRVLTVISFLGTLKLAQLVFFPPRGLLAALQPAFDLTGLSPTALIAAIAAVIVIAIFMAAAVMTIVEARYRDKTRRQFELFLVENALMAKVGSGTLSPADASKLSALSKLAINLITVLSLSSVLLIIWLLMLFVSPLISVVMILCAPLVLAFVLYFGARNRKKQAKLTKARSTLHAALSTASSEASETASQSLEGPGSRLDSSVRTRMLEAQDAQSRISIFQAQLDSVTLISTGALVGIAILLMVGSNVVSVILTLLLVRFFLNYARTLGRQLQIISDRLDIVDWARSALQK